jgi:hypothetical protein
VIRARSGRGQSRAGVVPERGAREPQYPGPKSSDVSVAHPRARLTGPCATNPMGRLMSRMEAACPERRVVRPASAALPQLRGGVGAIEAVRGSTQRPHTSA